MNRTLSAIALFVALGAAGLAHAQVNAVPPPAKPSAAEPPKQIPDPTLPNTSTGCGMANPESSGSAQPPSPSMSTPLPNDAAPCR
jgi:hypothetical protein